MKASAENQRKLEAAQDEILEMEKGIYLGGSYFSGWDLGRDLLVFFEQAGCSPHPKGALSQLYKFSLQEVAPL